MITINKSLDDQSFEELEDSLDKVDLIRHNIHKELQKRRLKDNFDFAGKYVKYYGCGCDGNPVYIKVYDVYITTEKDGSSYLMVNGHGFDAEFSDQYDDCNNFNWSTFYQIREPYDTILAWKEKNEEYLEERKIDKLRYYFVEISEHEFEDAFYKKIKKMKYMFRRYQIIK